MFGLFVPLLDILAILSDPEEWAELGQLPIHNLLLKSNSKEPVSIVQVKCKELDGIPCCNTFTYDCLSVTEFS